MSSNGLLLVRKTFDVLDLGHVGVSYVSIVLDEDLEGISSNLKAGKI